MHRLAAAGVAVAGLAVPLLLRQARQHLLHVQPLVRVQALGFGQLARVAQVRDADVVGSQGEPGAVRLLEVLGEAFLDHGEVLAAAVDALLGVQAVGNAHGLGGALGEHHQAAHAGLGRGGGLPEGFLVADGGQQAPVHLVLLRGLVEVLFVARQALLQMLGEGVGADIAEYIDVAVVTLLQALQGAVLARLVEEGVDLVVQAVVLARRHGPGQAGGVAQVEGDAYVGEVDLVHRQLVGVHQGQVDLPFVDHAQQVDHLHFVGFFVLQAGQGGLHGRQLLGVTAALEHHDAPADQVVGTGGTAFAVAVDDLGGDIQVGTGEAHFVPAGFAGDKAGGGQHRAIGLAQAEVEVIELVGGLDLELHAQVVGETLDQFVLEAGFAVAILEVGGRAVAGDHA
ncbi:hypothetical protein D3C85_864430 [compost metagenome]